MNMVWTNLNDKYLPRRPVIEQGPLLAFNTALSDKVPALRGRLCHILIVFPAVNVRWNLFEKMSIFAIFSY
jgi:hypothetical protein